MDILKQALRAVKQILFFVSFFNSFINSLMVFLLCSLIFFFFKIPWIYALIPFLLFLGITTLLGMKKVGYYDVEKKIPDLEWRLRTSADNADRDDELAMDLHHDVLERLQEVRATRIMNKKQLASKVAAVVGLCFVLLFVSANSIHFDDVVPALQKGITPITGFFGKAANLSEVAFGKEETTEDLYGDEEQIKYGGKEEVIELNQILGLVDIQKANRNKEGKDFKGMSSDSGNRGVFGSENSKESINEEDKDIVNNYFKKINNE